ncbi:MAG: hypothetical protein SGILL_010179 [Bacillariaceae sp.]
MTSFWRCLNKQLLPNITRVIIDFNEAEIEPHHSRDIVYDLAGPAILLEEYKAQLIDLSIHTTEVTKPARNLAEHFVPALKNLRSLRRVEMNNWVLSPQFFPCGIGPIDSGRMLIAAAGTLENLVELDLEDFTCGIDTIVQAQVVRLDNMQVPSVFILRLLQMRPAKLTTLDIGSCTLCFDGSSHISKESVYKNIWRELGCHPTLEYLAIRCEDGNFPRGILKAPALKTVILFVSDMVSTRTEELFAAELRSPNSSVETVKIQPINEISETSAHRLVTIMCAALENANIKDLTLGGRSGIVHSDVAFSLLMRQLCCNKTLLSLSAWPSWRYKKKANIETNHLALQKVLARNFTLEKLNIEFSAESTALCGMVVRLNKAGRKYITDESTNTKKNGVKCLQSIIETHQGLNTTAYYDTDYPYDETLSCLFYHLRENAPVFFGS